MLTPMHPILNPMLLQHIKISFPSEKDSFPKDGLAVILGLTQFSDLLADLFYFFTNNVNTTF